MRCASDLILNPGTDCLDRRAVYDDAGVVELTGGTASVYDVTGVLAGAVAVAIVSGQLELSITWQPGWPVVAATLGTFRVLIVLGGTEIGSFLVTVYVNGSETQVVVARGSDLTLVLTWPDDRDGSNLVGDVIDVINVAPALVGVVSAAISNAATREITWSIEGDPAMPLGDLGTFQLRRSTGGANRRTLNRIRVICK